MTSEIILYELARLNCFHAQPQDGVDAHCTLLRGNQTTTLHHSLTAKSYGGKVISELKNATWNLIEGRLWSHLNALLRAMGRPKNPGEAFGVETMIGVNLGKVIFPLLWALEQMPDAADARLAGKIFENWVNLKVEERAWLGSMGIDDKPGSVWRLACWAALSEATSETSVGDEERGRGDTVTAG